jgi:hypothetical protein
VDDSSSFPARLRSIWLALTLKRLELCSLCLPPDSILSRGSETYIFRLEKRCAGLGGSGKLLAMVKRSKKRNESTERAEICSDKIPGIQHNFYGAIIRKVRIGPRRELNLQVETWPEGSHRFGGGDAVTLRFGAVSNFAEVQSFFSKAPIDSLHYIRYLRESHERRHVIEMEFDRTGQRVKIISGKLSTWSADSKQA